MAKVPPRQCPPRQCPGSARAPGGSGRARRLCAPRRSQGGAQPLGAQPLPRVLGRAASKAADSPAG
eukprot:scaffold54785_cov48-Phaeocystis_antarctica.AAC.1